MIQRFPNGATHLTIFDCKVFYFVFPLGRRTRNGSRGPVGPLGRLALSEVLYDQGLNQVLLT